MSDDIIQNPPLRFFAMVRDGAAFDWLAVAPCLTFMSDEAGKEQGDEKQPVFTYPMPPLDENIKLVQIERGFDTLSERVDPDTGKIAPDLGSLAAALHAQIDAEYEARVVVPGPVKAAEYSAKLAEARALIDGGEPGPMLIAEAGGGDALKLAESIVGRAEQASSALAAKAAARRAAKTAVAEATDAEAMRAVVWAFIEGMRAQ